MVLSWLRNLLTGSAHRGSLSSRGRRRATYCPRLEDLEGRWVPAAIRNTLGFNTVALPPGDFGPTPTITPALGFTMNFYGTNYNSIFVHYDGVISLGVDYPNAFLDLSLMTGNSGIPTIAPFFSDVLTADLLTGTNVGAITYGSDTICGYPAFAVTWTGVGYFDVPPILGFNSFQVVLIDRTDTGPGNFDIEFNYDQIQWETGFFEGGVGGIGGAAAQIGVSNGSGLPGTSYFLPGSGVAGTYLDTGTAPLINGYLNSSTPGRYHLFFRGGAPTLTPQNADLEVTAATEVNYPFRYTTDPEESILNGNLTLTNIGGPYTLVSPSVCLDEYAPITTNPTFSGPITVLFPQMPTNIVVLNPTGVTPSGLSYITVDVASLPTNTALRVPISLSNPEFADPAPSTFNLGFPVRVFAGPFDPTVV